MSQPMRHLHVVPSSHIHGSVVYQAGTEVTRRAGFLQECQERGGDEE